MSRSSGSCSDNDMIQIKGSRACRSEVKPKPVHRAQSRWWHHEKIPLCDTVVTSCQILASLSSILLCKPTISSNRDIEDIYVWWEETDPHFRGADPGKHLTVNSLVSLFSCPGGESCSPTPETTPRCAPQSWVGLPGWAVSSVNAALNWSPCPSTAWRITTAGPRCDSYRVFGTY